MERFRLTLLGSGVPAPDPARFGPATLIEAGSVRFLVDAGRGATMRLFQLGIPIGSIDLLLLTHFHSDHVVGIPDLWLTGWLGGRFGCRTTPMRVAGPSGTKHLISHMVEAFSADITIRIADEQLPEAGSRIEAQEFSKDCLVYSDEAVRVSCFEVDHGRFIKPAFGYRFDYGGQTAVVSGDTRYNENLIAHSEGVDLLVHEVAMACPEAMKIERIRRIIGHHSTPHDAARVFNRTRPRLAAYSHVVLLGDNDAAPPSTRELIDETRQYYRGPLIVGEDLMSFDISATSVTATVVEPISGRPAPPADKSNVDDLVSGHDVLTTLG